MLCLSMTSSLGKGDQSYSTDLFIWLFSALGFFPAGS